MKVKDHKKFCCFEYVSHTNKNPFKLGDVVIGIETDYPSDNVNSIGVVIQIHNIVGEFRVDMFGNTSEDEVRIATLKEIEKYRPKLLSDLQKEDTEPLCKCNNCGSILIDENPQINATEFVLKGNETNMMYCDSKEDGIFWACPICGTDEFLEDINEY